MAAAFRSFESHNVSGTQSEIVCGKPSGVIQGDGLIAILRCDDDTVTFTAPAGWTLEDSQIDSSSNFRTEIFSKVAGASEGSSYTFTLTGHGVGDQTFISINAFSGTNLTDLVDFVSSTVNSASTGGATPSRANSILLIGAHNTGNTNAGTYAVATSSPSFTEIYDTWNNTVEGYPDVALAYGIRPETTATGDASTSSTNETTFFIILNPADDVTIAPAVLSLEARLFMVPDFITAPLQATISLFNVIREKFTAQGKSSSSWNNQNKS